MKNIALSYAEMHYEEPIIKIVFKEKAQLGFPEIRELTRNAEKLSGGKSYFTLCYVPEITNVTPLGRKVAADINEAPLNKATAVIVKHGIVERTANFFYKGKRSGSLFKVFTDHREAHEWLTKLKGGQDQRPD
jgi:hypothetical protein